MREGERNRVCVREEKVGRGKERGEGREGGGKGGREKKTNLPSRRCRITPHPPSLFLSRSHTYTHISPLTALGYVSL